MVGIRMADIRPAATAQSRHGVVLFCCSDNENKGNMIALSDMFSSDVLWLISSLFC